MISQITITDTTIKSDYSAYMVAIYKDNGGRWNPTQSVWTFAGDKVAQIAKEYYGTSDNLVTVEVTESNIERNGNQEMVGGYVLATRRYRDGKVTLGTGVELISGEFPRCGGSARQPAVESRNAVYRITVPTDFAAAHGLSGQLVEVKPASATQSKPAPATDDYLRYADIILAQVIGCTAEDAHQYRTGGTIPESDMARIKSVAQQILDHKANNK